MSSCICKPWRGYHLDQCPCQAKYEEIKAESQPSASNREEAVKLVAEGWLQTSRKYRQIVKVPLSDPLAELERLDPERAAKVRASAEEYLRNQAIAALHHYGEKRELTPALFEAFREEIKKMRGW